MCFNDIDPRHERCYRKYSQHKEHMHRRNERRMQETIERMNQERCDEEEYVREYKIKRKCQDVHEEHE